MRKIWTLLTAFTMMFSVANAGDKITIKSITNGDFAAEMMQGMNPCNLLQFPAEKIRLQSYSFLPEQQD